MCQISRGDIAYSHYPTQYPLATSSKIEPDFIAEVGHRLLHNWVGVDDWTGIVPNNKRAYPSGIVFYVDRSSVRPHFEIRNATYLIESSVEKTIETIFEHYIVFQMPPKRKYKIELELKSIKKAKPKFVEPDTF